MTSVGSLGLSDALLVDGSPLYNVSKRKVFTSDLDEFF